MRRLAKLCNSDPSAVVNATPAAALPIPATAIHICAASPRVQLAPYAVKEIDRSEERINVTRDHVKSSPAWDPLAMAEQVGEQQLHRHFGWPGYGG